MNNTPETPAGQPADIEPLDVMRAVFRDAEFHFEEEESQLFLRLKLECVDVSIVCCGEPDDVAAIAITLPVRATPEFRAKAGEFLHRLNYCSKRKFWEMDYNDGEIRMAAYLDTVTGPLTGVHFWAFLRCLVKTADTVFPYLTSVLSGRLTPEFAADQTEAALNAMWNDGKQTGEDPTTDEN